jgi:hypothetical protein
MSPQRTLLPEEVYDMFEFDESEGYSQDYREQVPLLGEHGAASGSAIAPNA